jgi:transcriptional regulator with XRE-family HTH domain
MVQIQNPPAKRFDASKLRDLREAKGLSRQALADRCPHVSYAAIRSYEEGRNKPDIDRALELAAALRVAVRHLTTS